ncbi:hypothetical protein B0A55_01438 [Friedmanniomyces simplex]|uniref:AB hydrolase-1 domain-containing protein n=1 Tax=Friedmanniomyces simplex TaxID=329884 RepID=A0A4U0XX08_9PEZI|nr:hypothetical protein B0A55_01438 [Friedmanniomyces simplex]
MAHGLPYRGAGTADASVHDTEAAFEAVLSARADRYLDGTLRVNEAEYRRYTPTSLTFLLGLPNGRYLVRASSSMIRRATSILPRTPWSFFAVKTICRVLRRQSGTRPSARDLAADTYLALKRHCLLSKALEQATAGMRFQQCLCDFVADMVEEALKTVVGPEGIRRASRKGIKGVARAKYQSWLKQNRRPALHGFRAPRPPHVRCITKAKILGDAPDKPIMIANHGAPGLSTHKETEAWSGPFTDIFPVLDMGELRQWAKAEKFVMSGGSRGGSLTLEYAFAYQQHLYGIVVSDSAAQMSRWVAVNQSRAHRSPQTRLELDTDFGSIAALYAAPPEVKGHTEVDVDAVLSAATMPFCETGDAAMGDCLRRYDVRGRLQDIKVPAFTAVGRYGRITPVQCCEELAAKKSTSRLMVYERSGHLPGLEEETKFWEGVRDFLKTLDVPGLKL